MQNSQSNQTDYEEDLKQMEGDKSIASPQKKKDLLEDDDEEMKEEDEENEDEASRKQAALRQSMVVKVKDSAQPTEEEIKEYEHMMSKYPVQLPILI